VEPVGERGDCFLDRGDPLGSLRAGPWWSSPQPFTGEALEVWYVSLEEGGLTPAGLRVFFLSGESKRRRGHAWSTKERLSPSLLLVLLLFPLFSLPLSFPFHPVAHSTHRMSAFIPALTALSLAAAASSHRVCSAASFPSSSECASRKASRPPSPGPPRPLSVALTYFSYLLKRFD